MPKFSKSLGAATPSRNGHTVQVGRDGRVILGGSGPAAEAARFIRTYMVMPDLLALVIATWVLAAWLNELWDKFPHLAISSPDKRCGKTLLLELLYLLVPSPRYTVNISPAALYRVVEKEKPTLLMDESQSISRRGSEASEVIREILNAGIQKNAKVIRCGGEGRDQIEEFSVYSPKVFAMIGAPDGVLADRCLPIPLKRKTDDEPVARYRSREVEQHGTEIKATLEAWAAEHKEEVLDVYQEIEPFDIDNDRMADLLMPLQAVLQVADPEALDDLEQYAGRLNDTQDEVEKMSPGVQLLMACREIFQKYKTDFLSTDLLLRELIAREEEPWSHWTRGAKMTAEALAKLLRDFGVRSERTNDRKRRGYFRVRFEEAWKRYLPPPLLNHPANPAIPARTEVEQTLAATLDRFAKGGRG
jgi:hypothetical protein